MRPSPVPGCLSALLCVLLAGAGGLPAAEEAYWSPAAYPRVDGSLATQPLGMQVACTALGLETEWSAHWGAERRLVPVDFHARNPSAATEWVRQNITHSGTAAAYRSLLARSADLLLVTRRPLPEEERRAGALGFALDVRPLALDALVFLVHEENPVGSLMPAELREVFSGRIGNWGGVGGRYGEIRTVVRPEGAVEERFLRQALGSTDLTGGAEARVAMRREAVAEIVGQDPLAIGYTTYVYAAHVRAARPVRFLPVAGVLPEPETIRAGDYPYVQPVFLVTREGTQPDSGAGMLRRWLLSREGQTAVAGSGFVPLPEYLWLDRRAPER